MSQDLPPRQQLVNQCQQSLLNCLSYNIISPYRVDERRIEEFGPDRYMYFLSHQYWSNFLHSN